MPGAFFRLKIKCIPRKIYIYMIYLKEIEPTSTLNQGFSETISSDIGNTGDVMPGLSTETDWDRHSNGTCSFHFYDHYGTLATFNGLDACRCAWHCSYFQS